MLQRLLFLWRFSKDYDFIVFCFNYPSIYFKKNNSTLLVNDFYLALVKCRDYGGVIPEDLKGTFGTRNLYKVHLSCVQLMIRCNDLKQHTS